MSDKSGGGRRTRAALAAGGRRATRSTLDARNAVPARASDRRGPEKSAKKRARASDEDDENEAKKKKKKPTHAEEKGHTPTLVASRRRRATASSEADEETKGGEEPPGETRQEEETPVTKRRRGGVIKVAVRRTRETSHTGGEGAESQAPSSNRVHVEEEEEETKGGEDPPEEEAEATGSRYRTRVDLVADADFLRAAVAARERMETAPRKMVVWDEIAENRFRSGRVAKARLEWLQQVRRDRSHAEHRRLTGEMTEMLVELDTAAKAAKAVSEGGKPVVAETTPASPKSPKNPKKRKKLGFTDPARLRRLKRQALLQTTATVVADKVATPTTKAGSGTAREDARELSTPANADNTSGSRLAKSQKSPTFDPVAEERLMQIVLDHAEKFKATDKKLDVWEEIAYASREQYGNGISTKNHVWWVVRSLRDPEHRVTKNSTPKLRDMVRQYVEVHTKITSEEVQSTVAIVGTKTAPKQLVPESPAIAPVTLATASSVQQIIDVAVDKLLVLLVSEKIPSRNTNQASEKTWDEIAIALQSPTIMDGVSAKARFTWLLSVFEDRTHAEREKLTRSLRKMLEDYISPHVSREMDTPPMMPLVAAEVEARVVDRSLIQSSVSNGTDDNDAGGDRNRADGSQDYKRPSTSQVDLHSDEELMRLVLLLRPFEADRTTKSTVWAKIVDTLQAPKITNGLAAHSRVRWLLNVYQQSTHSEHGRLSHKLRSMLNEYGSINGTAKADVISRVLDLNVDVSGSDDDNDPRADPNNGLLLRELLRLRPFHAKLGTGMGVWKQVAANVNRAAGVRIHPNGQSCLSQMKRLLAVFRNTTKSDIYLTKRQLAWTELVDALLKIRWPKSKNDITDDHRACLEKIQRVLDGQPDLRISPRRPAPREFPTPQEHAAPQFTYEPSPRVDGVDPVEALQGDIARFRETAARDRASREEELTRVKQQVNACRVKLTDQMDKYDEERREQRDELRSVMELLKQEREMHARENDLVLQVVQKEREDRRQEFGTLINLVTRAVLGSAHVQPNA